MTKLILALAAIGVSVIGAMSQPSRAPEARTPEEFDSYLEFHEAVDTEARHGMALRFERAYPESELLIDIYQSEFEYARSHEQRQAAIAAAEKKLRLAPNDFWALLDLAEVLPNGTSDPLILSRAEEYARRALAELKEMQFPPEVSLSQCEGIQKSLLSRAHAALGYVFGKRGELAEAIKELETAVAASPEPVGSQLFRLGKLYRASKREQDAIEMFRRAAKAGPTEIRLLAESELKGRS